MKEALDLSETAFLISQDYASKVEQFLADNKADHSSQKLIVLECEIPNDQPKIMIGSKILILVPINLEHGLSSTELMARYPHRIVPAVYFK